MSPSDTLETLCLDLLCWIAEVEPSHYPAGKTREDMKALFVRAKALGVGGSLPKPMPRPKLPPREPNAWPPRAARMAKSDLDELARASGPKVR